MIKLTIALTLLLCAMTATADSIVIDGPLGLRSKHVNGIESMSQQGVALYAALLALSPDGWNLESFGGTLKEYLPPYWSGGIEWGVGDIPAEYSEDWGYELNEEAIQYGGYRGLIFHTDDTISRLSHDVCEPSPFGIISGLMSGAWSQCAVTDWGEFYVDDTATGLPNEGEVLPCTFSTIKSLY